MLRLKSCPRCKGDIRIDKDQYGWYEECIQCGYTHDLPDIHPAGKPVLAEDNGDGNTDKPVKPARTRPKWE